MTTASRDVLEFQLVAMEQVEYRESELPTNVAVRDLDFAFSWAPGVEPSQSHVYLAGAIHVFSGSAGNMKSLVLLQMRFSFYFRGFPFVDPAGGYTVPTDLLVTLVGIVYHRTAGVLFEKLRQSQYAGLILPAINPTDLFELTKPDSLTPRDSPSSPEPPREEFW